MGKLMITAAEFERRMNEIAHPQPVKTNGSYIDQAMYRAANISSSHEEADDLMCEVLKSLGYEAGVKIFEEMTKWYE